MVNSMADALKCLGLTLGKEWNVESSASILFGRTYWYAGPMDFLWLNNVAILREHILNNSKVKVSFKWLTDGLTFNALRAMHTTAVIDDVMRMIAPNIKWSDTRQGYEQEGRVITITEAVEKLWTPQCVE